LVLSFLAAARQGDVSQLVDLLAADAVFCGDGGGKATAVAEPLHGRDQIAGFLVAIFERNLRLGLSFEPVRVNGRAGIISRDRNGNLVNVLSIDVTDGVIQTLRSVVNPDKLKHLGPVSDFLRIGPADGDGQLRATR
jgi:RNA polymerase sigma-70 factor (ECF subfamily)